jgi:hypothetical protein
MNDTATHYTYYTQSMDVNTMCGDVEAEAFCRTFSTNSICTLSVAQKD